jgi:hypothetical protein
MAAKKSSPTFEFTRNYLTKKPGATFAEVQTAAQKKGLKVIPVVYGRAKKLLGLAKPAKKKKVAAKRGRPATGARRGRPRKTAAASTALGTLEGVLQAMRRNDAERQQLRATLERIRDLIDKAL